MQPFKRLAALPVLAGLSGAVLGQGFPNKPIRLIVPYPAGESIDSVARLTAQHWSAALAVPELRNQLIDQGAEPVGSTPEEFGKFMDGDWPSGASSSRLPAPGPNSPAGKRLKTRSRREWHLLSGILKSFS